MSTIPIARNEDDILLEMVPLVVGAIAQLVSSKTENKKQEIL